MRRKIRLYVFLCLLIGLGWPSSLPAQGNPAGLASPSSRSERRAAKYKRELGLIATPRGTVDACTRQPGPNVVNFLNRGRTAGERTYMYGVDLCTRRPFVYSEPTHQGVIVGFDANPPDIAWADNPADSRNHRGDRFGFEILAGVEMIFIDVRTDFGGTTDRVLDIAVAPSVGFRTGRLSLTASHAVYPLETTWMGKVAVMPFRRGPPKRRLAVADVSETGDLRYFEPVGSLCNRENIGVRGVDHFRLGERQGRTYPISLTMVSYCAPGHAAYEVTGRTRQPHFDEFNNTFPAFADWGEIPRGGLLNNLAIIAGFGHMVSDANGPTFSTDVLYVGLGIAFGDSRWRVDIGRLISLESKEILTDLDPIVLTADGWSVHLQRALHLDALF